MAILNYSTSIDAWKTVSEIQQLLAKGRATNINIKSDGGLPVGIMFSIDYMGQSVNFALPC